MSAHTHDATATRSGKQRLVFPGMGVLFVVLACCFLSWGIAADLTTPMVAGFKRIFNMSTFEASRPIVGAQALGIARWPRWGRSRSCLRAS